jgi:hypothetical protein
MKNKYYIYDDFRLIGEAVTLADACKFARLPLTVDSARVHFCKNNSFLNKDNIYIFRIGDREARVRYLADMIKKRAATHPDLIAVERKLVEIVRSMLGREI